VELDITGRLNYTTGDHVGIFPMNEPELVERYLDLEKFR
jgi:sulfite reductase alpha subunit-like flavoprotein